MGCFGSRVFCASKVEVLFGDGALVRGCLDTSVLFSGGVGQLLRYGRFQCWCTRSRQVPESVGEKLGGFLVSEEERVAKSALIGKNRIALQAVSGGCQGHVANMQHVQFRSFEISSTLCLSFRSSVPSISDATC